MTTRTIRLLIITVLFLLLTTTFSISYFFLLKPIELEIEQTMLQLQQESEILQTLQKRVEQQRKSALINTIELQQKIPVEPMIDTFILGLKSVEQNSTSKLNRLSFSEVDGRELLIEGEVAEGEVIQETGNEDSIAEEDKGLRRIIVDMSVTSPTYEHLQQFIHGLESLDRIIKIDHIVFGAETRNINYRLTISTFFAPQFQGVVDELPKTDFPEPSQKTNPLQN